MTKFEKTKSRNIATHEDFSRIEKVEVSSERSFGLVFASIFLLVAFAPLLRPPYAGSRWWAFGVAVVFAGLALFWTTPLVPLNRLWQRVGLFLNRVMSPIALGLIFATTIIPIGLLMRAIGKDPLDRKRAPDAASYWIMRQPPGPPAETMENQF